MLAASPTLVTSPPLGLLDRFWELDSSTFLTPAGQERRNTQAGPWRRFPPNRLINMAASGRVLINDRKELNGGWAVFSR